MISGLSDCLIGSVIFTIFYPLYGGKLNNIKNKVIRTGEYEFSKIIMNGSMYYG